MKEIQWLPKPQAHDYPAAAEYLSLIESNDSTIERGIHHLRNAAIRHYKAKDIIRAAGLLAEHLTEANAHVAKNLAKIADGKPLSPVLLVRISACPHLVIADGFHRVCAAYLYDEDAVIPCKIV